MGKLNMKEWISQTIQRKETIAIPIMTHPGIEFIGKTVRFIMRLSKLFVTSIRLRQQPLSWI